MRHEYSDDYQAFYDAYPRRDGKFQGYKTWRKLIADIPADVMMDALERAKSAWAAEKRLPKFIPHPSTWLNQRPWEDERILHDDYRQPDHAAGLDDGPAGPVPEVSPDEFPF